VSCRGTNLRFYVCMPACVPVCLSVCTLNKSFKVRLIAKNSKKIFILWGEFFMACDFYLLFYPDLPTWRIRKQANGVTPDSELSAWCAHESQDHLQHATDNGVTRLSNRSGCDQPPKRPPALKKKRSKAGHAVYNNGYLLTPVLGLCIYIYVVERRHRNAE
jgi:hypothetical protein